MPPRPPSAAAPPQARRWTRRDFATDAVTLAKKLLGQSLVRTLGTGERLAGIIVETEAYLGDEDKAAHSFGLRRTARNESMYGPPGTAYVYFTYGMHHCMNVVCGRPGEPVAALLRALDPVEGLETMRHNRSRNRLPGAPPLSDRDLCSGPGKLCMALAIDRALDGASLPASPVIHIEQARRAPLRDEDLLVTPRIGVAYAGDWADAPLRFAIKGNPHISRR